MTPKVMELGQLVELCTVPYSICSLLSSLEEKLKSLKGMREAEGGRFMIEHKAF